MPNSVEEFLQHATFEEVDLSYKIANTTIDQVVEAVLKNKIVFCTGLREPVRLI